MIHNAEQAQSKEHITYIQLCHEDNPMCPSSSPQWLCGNILAMDGQWRFPIYMKMKYEIFLQ